MKKNEFLVQIMVVEARDLQAKDSSGTSDPFVRISVGNLPPQVTTAKQKATTAVFNQNFTFEKLYMNEIDFENFEAKLEVFDQNAFFQNELIGSHSIGLATLYRNPSHEIYNKWLPLINPKDVKKTQGYILVSAYIIGEGDQAPVHDANENNVEDEPDEFGGVPDDQLTSEELQRRREKLKQIAMVMAPKPYSKQAQLLVNIVKADDLPLLNGGTMDSFVSVRVNGITQITTVVKSTQKPQYRTRMLFPIFFPLNNDKIVIRLWDKRVCLADTFIGQIPEVPSEDDYFNIVYLQSKGGVLPFRWFSIYGIPKDERPSGYDSLMGYTKNPTGTAYMGRILLSLNLSPSEKPEKGIQPIGIYREPQIERYTIRLDTYEINQSKENGDSVFIRVRAGGQYLDSEVGLWQSEGTYMWKQKQIVKTLDVETVKSVDQQTDLIVELYNFERKRCAYMRIPTSSYELGNDRPIWYKLKELRALKDGTEPTHSYALLNIIFRPCAIVNQFPKQIVRRNLKLEYKCRIYMYAGYDLCPDKFSDEISISWDIRIADQLYKYEKQVASKNPIWNQKLTMVVQMEQNLEFVSNIVISFYDKNKKIGQANVAAMNCKTGDGSEEIIPSYQFYHIVSDGRSIGRILMGITLEKQKKNQQLKTELSIVSEKIVQEYLMVRSAISIYAIRQLPKKLKLGRLTARISIPLTEGEGGQQQLHQEQQIKTYLVGGDEETVYSKGYSDPNFLEIIKLSCYLPIPPEPLFTPQIELEIKGEGQKFYTPVPLIQYLMNMDQNYLFQLSTYFNMSCNKDFSQPFILKGADGQPQPTQSAKQSIKQSVKSQHHNSHKKSVPIEQRASVKKKIDKINLDDVKSDEENIKQNKNRQEQKENQQNNESDQESLIINQNEEDKKTPAEIIYEMMRDRGIENSFVQDQEDLEITESEIKDQQLLQKQKAKRLTGLLYKIPRDTPNAEATKQYIKKEILSLPYKPVDSELYLLEKTLDIQDDGIDYGRPIIKGRYEDELQKLLPYKRLKIFELVKGSSGIGSLTNAILKADVKFIKNPQVSVKKSQIPFPDVKEIKLRDYPFDFFDPTIFNYLKIQQFHCKVRVYIYRCLSLAAQSQSLDTYHIIAGEQARNSANPFIEIEVGEPGADPGDYVKKVSEPERFIENSLSPTFCRSFELDALLPLDCFMQLKIFHRGGIRNPLIGEVKIDIEDRLMGEKKLKQRISFQAYKDYFETELERLKLAENADQVKQDIQAEIADLTQKIESFSSELIIPVEYQQLKHPDKLVSQGTVEMFMEVLPLDVARVVPPSKLVERQPQEYEVRLIIWETFNIPKTTKKVVDIFCKVTMDSSATISGQEEVKETDTHMGSEDGNGEFNWRMKFSFRTPCQFPRMKISVYDFFAFGTSPSIGEATISLKRVLSVMRTQSSYEMAPTQIKLSSSASPDQDLGSVLVQMSIISKSMADGKPVGEGQNEPNIDPFLRRPTAGRGLGDFFKGFGIPWGMICRQACAILLPMFISALISFILFVKPGILVPQQP